MKDPNPPTLLRLRPTVAKARYHEALNLEGLDTVILDGAPVSPLALAKISMPASCHRKSTWERSSRGCAFSVCTSVNRFIFLSARNRAEGKSCGNTLHRLSNISSRIGLVPRKRRASRMKTGGASEAKVSFCKTAVPMQISLTRELMSSTTIDWCDILAG